MHHDKLLGTVSEAVPTPAKLLGDATAYIAEWVAPYNCQVVSVGWRPSAAITGANTNTFHLNLDDGGAAGAGSTELGNVDYVSGTDEVMGATRSLYAPAAAVARTQGQVYRLERELVGNGIATPSGSMIVTYRAN